MIHMPRRMSIEHCAPQRQRPWFARAAMHDSRARTDYLAQAKKAYKYSVRLTLQIDSEGDKD